MAYVKRIFECATARVETKYHTYRFGGPKTRKANENETSKQQKRINSKNSIRHLAELIATNFQEDDMRIDLTYAGEAPTPEEAKKEVNRFLDRCRRVYKKAGIPFKWVLVTEYQAESSRKKGIVRVHHHLLMNSEKGKVSFADIRRLWHRARLNYRSMRVYDGTYDDACALAVYLTKETDKTYAEEGTIQKRRYRTSRNLMQPIVKTEIIQSKHWAEKPKQRKGYTIADVYNGYTPEGYPFQRVTMLKDLTEKDHQKWVKKIQKVIQKGLRKRRKKAKHGKR